MKTILILLVSAFPTARGKQPDFFGILSNEEEGQGVFRCGASLIHEDIMVTSSFCTQVGDVVRVGYKNDTDAIAIRTVVEFVTHPLAGGPRENLPNDIEVFKLSEPIKEITPVKINTISAVPPDNGATVYYAHAGAVPDVMPGKFILGKVPLSRVFSTELITNTAKTANFRFCGNAYKNLVPYYQSRLQEGLQLCATTSAEVGPCDSAAWGSPLWIMVKDEPVLVGTASQGSCTEGYPPFIWTRVAYYATWLAEQICALSPETGCRD